jgi:hypothetical protein
MNEAGEGADFLRMFRAKLRVRRHFHASSRAALTARPRGEDVRFGMRCESNGAQPYHLSAGDGKHATLCRVKRGGRHEAFS